MNSLESGRPASAATGLSHVEPVGAPAKKAEDAAPELECSVYVPSAGNFKFPRSGRGSPSHSQSLPHRAWALDPLRS